MDRLYDCIVVGAGPQGCPPRFFGLDIFGLIWVDQTQQTSVAGVYAAGDITPNSQLAIVAAAEGPMAAIHIHQSLIPLERKLD
jgi:thioredoxin reductase